MLFFPNTKINIGLNIVSKRSDGYHNIETVFCPIGLADALEFIETPGLPEGNIALSLSGNPVDGDMGDNLCIKAYKLLAGDFHLPAVAVHLHKIVPLGAGLGGGSADAAFMLKNLNEKFQLRLSDDDLCQYASLLGSDCAFFIRNTPLFAYDRGHLFREISHFPEDIEIMVVHPGIHISTAEAYAGVHPHKPLESLENLINLPAGSWKGKIVNDFEDSVFRRHPLIRDIKNKLYDLGAVYASMSGSGSSVFGLFQTKTPETAIQFPDLFTWKGKVYKA